MEVNTLVLTISILVAFSGWAKFFYDLLTSGPKIRGQIFNVIIGEMANPENPGENLTGFIVYLYLTNIRKNSVHILDYELEVDSGDGFERLLRVYGVQNVQNWDFSSQTHLIEIPDFNQKLIYSSNRPVEYGAPLHGFVVFASKTPKHSFFKNGDNRKYNVTVIDAFRKRHKIVASEGKFPSLYLLQDLAGIKLVPPRK